MATQVAKSKRRAEWVRRVTRLTDEIVSWAKAQGWSVNRTKKTLTEDPSGEYAVPALHLRTPAGELYVTPVALDVHGTEGRVDVEAWPSLNRVRLIGRPGGWQVMTDSNVPLPGPWNKKAFVDLVGHLQT